MSLYKNCCIFLLCIAIAGPSFGQSEQCQIANRGMESMHVESISVENGNGRLITIEAYIADDNFERSQGYQFICERVIDSSFILFVYPQPVNGRFHMTNVRAPLDIAFFDHQGILVKQLLMKTYEDGNRTLYSPDQPYQFALEARAGFFHSQQIREGLAQLVLQSLYDNN